MPVVQKAVHEYVDQRFPISQVTQSNGTAEDQPKDGETKKRKGSQILQNLILHRKVCNHPLFVEQHLS